MTNPRLLLIAILVTVPPSIALAQNHDKAQRKHNEAILLWELARYDDAIVLLQEGYKLLPTASSFIVNTANVYESAGELELKLDNRLVARRYLAIAADILGHYADRLPKGDPRARPALARRDALNLRVDSLREKPEPEEAPAARPKPQSTPIPPIPRPAASRVYTIQEVDRADRVFRNVGLSLNTASVAFVALGVGLVVTGVGLNSEIKDASMLNDWTKWGELTGRKDSLLLSGGAALALSATMLATGTIALVLPTKHRIALISFFQGIGVKGEF